MKNNIGSRLTILAWVLWPALLCAQAIEKPEPIGEPAKKLYRQVMPDGGIVYSDKPVKGAKLDDTLTVDPASEGKSWAPESGRRPSVQPRAESTPIKKVPNIPPVSRRKTLTEADADVTKAEMLLEDARRRREVGAEPLPGERTGNVGGGSRLNEAYEARQNKLAKDVADLEEMLKRARSERNTLLSTR